MAESSPLAPHVEDIVRSANRQFEDAISEAEAEAFKTKGLDEVEKDARNLEQRLAEKGELPNMARLRDFYAGVKNFERSCAKMDVTVMHLPWTWVGSNDFLLEASSVNPAVIKVLTRAFKELGQTLALVDLSDQARDSTESQEVLAMIYSSVLEVHCRLLGLMRKHGWQVCFRASWDSLGKRLRRIRLEIAQLAGLLRQKELGAQLADARQDRDSWRGELDERETNVAIKQRKNVAAWLIANELDQEDELDRIARQCHPQSCDWIFDNGKIKSWIRRGNEHNVVWLKGKPGSGKSVLCSTIVKKLQDSRDMEVFYFICTESQPRSKYCPFLLRALVWQLVRSKPDLTAFVEAEYVNAGVTLSTGRLRTLLALIISTIPTVRIVVDGLDECERQDQEAIYESLSPLANTQNRASSCKVLISSQDSSATPRKLRQRTSVDLSKEVSARKSIEAAITTFVRFELTQNSVLVDDIDQAKASKVEQILLSKADGMFLWVRLVLAMLEEATTLAQMLEYLKDLPPELDAVYKRIFARVLPSNCQSLSDQSKRHQVSQVFQLLTYGKRPMKRYEIRDAVTMCLENVTFIDDENRVRDAVFDHCKPLIEFAPDNTVRFIHVSVKDYLLKYHQLFSEEHAQGNIAMSCVKYLSNAINLVDPGYAEDKKRSDVARGYHGLCLYASKHFIGHLLAYIELAHASVQSDVLEYLLQAADGLAGSIQLFAPYQVSADHGDKLDQRCNLLSGRPALFSLVSSELALFSDTNTRPRMDASVAKQQGLGSIRSAYEDIARSILQADTLPGLKAEKLKWFKETYSTSVLVCRARGCLRGLHGFATSKERDEHESSHRLDLRCPHEDCPKGNPSFSSPNRRKAHLKQFHDEEPVRLPEPKQPLGVVRVDTEATLVDDVVGNDGFHDLISPPLWTEDDEDGNESDIGKAVYDFLQSDQFALQTATRWL